MEKYRSKGIKDIIAEFPGVEKILEEYGIGCGPCTVGICQLKDILEIHQIPREAEEELMCRIEAAIYPERNLHVSSHSAGKLTSSGKQVFSAPLQVLVDEHKLIKRWLLLIPQLIKDFDFTSAEDRRVVEHGIDFIRSYADHLHHGKEEDILFTYFDDTAEIFRVIYEDHRKARALVQEMLYALDTVNIEVLTSNLQEYAALLSEHIHKEDEVLFPWLDSRLAKEQVNELTTRFENFDRRLALNDRKFQLFIEGLEHQFS
ncbi:hemerythrin domain-containing protein [Desulforhopalus sp. IMCC35007]|uniref:hemerythrin domain-containing protein n=1 Tax=Desulforhopalus sp. IMCC35007 TaxID=2569543 RepID=UPI0010AE373C|nr:hemerythrin domain-containing protein [Desulforhopalus sp. IMCC35007]TKB06401.1 hypothetical protein FCL48_21300 [Desulforhopalus sp. IMCC35007]